MNKKAKIKKLVNEMLRGSVKEIKDKLIDKALNSGCVDVDRWSETYGSMVLPKYILIDTLLHEDDQYSGKGTCFEKRVKKEVKNISLFL